MIHLCFIVDNSLTMDQRPNKLMSLLEIVKSSIENTLRNLYRVGFQNSHEHIHLFCTSSPNSPLSSFQHDELHLYCQLKSISTSLYTDPAKTIQNAINHISRFRILSEAQTLKGYREAYIYEPSLIVFISDRMTRKKIQDLITLIDKGKLFMRSQYQLAAYMVGNPSYTQRNLLTQEVFKSTLENQKQIKLYEQSLMKISSDLRFVLNYESLNNYLWNRIETFKPSLLFHFQLKQLKKKTSELAPSERGSAYFKAWENYLDNVPFKLVPSKLWKIPLPFPTKCSEVLKQQKIESFGQFRFYLDLSKRYVDQLSNLLPENRYKILSNPAISMLEKDNFDERFPIFFDHKGVQCLAGLLIITPKGSEIIFFFGNFNALNSILKSVSAKQSPKSLQSSIYSYLSSVPHFYHKFLKIIFDKLGLSLDYDHFENPLLNTPNFSLQAKLQAQRLLEKKALPKIFQTNLQSHQNFTAKCCITYNSAFWKKKITRSIGEESDKCQQFFSQLIGDLLSFKYENGIEDYLTSNQISPVPMIKQTQRYGNIRRTGDDDFNENIAINLGNPYRKKKKAAQQQPKEKQSDTVIANKNPPANQQTQKNTIMPFIKEASKIIESKQAVSVPIIKIVIEEEQPQEVIEQISNQKDSSLLKAQQNVIAIEEEIFNDETVVKFNSFPLQKSIQLRFNPINLATNLSQRNETIMNKFWEKLKRK